jgi:indole-3-glycerol phosphate synthase
MSFLTEILVSTSERVARSKRAFSPERLQEGADLAEPPRGFRAALGASEEVALVAEIKRATPSEGILDASLDARVLAASYERGGASAISVLTEPHHFLGSIEDLVGARAAVSLPVLRKDFIIDEWQVIESRSAGADAVLLIARCIQGDLASFVDRCRALGMDALVEVFDETDVERALAAGADLIGINHRDLETFEMDPERTARLLPSIPPDVMTVSLSGVTERSEVVAYGHAGASAVLVGTGLVRAADPSEKLKELLGR